MTPASSLNDAASVSVDFSTLLPMPSDQFTARNSRCMIEPEACLICLSGSRAAGMYWT